MTAPSVNNIQSFATTTADTTSPVTLSSYNVPSGGSDKILIVLVNYEDEGLTISGVTFGSDSLTQAVTDGGTYEHAEIWYKINPTVQTADIDVAFSGAVRGHWVLGAYYLTGGKQTSPVEDTGSDLSSPFSISLTTSTDDCLLVATCTNGSDHEMTAGSGFTKAYDIGSGSSQGMSQYKDAGTAGAQTVDWTSTGFQPMGVAAAFAPASGVTAVITGTVTGITFEDEIVDGGETIIITLTGDTWVTAGATFNAARQAIIDGLDSAGAESTGWNAEVRDKEVVGSVVRTSDTVVTITLTAAASYAITSSETITVTVPASAVDSGIDIDATPTFTVIPEIIPDQFIPIDAATETDTANTLTALNPQAVTLSASTETDTANTLAALNPETVTLGVASETGTANTLGILSPESIELGAALESDTANSLTVLNPQTITLSVSTETDTANTLTVDAPQVITLSAALETDVANTLSPLTGVGATLSPATETDTANALTVVTPVTVVLTAATETDVAQPLTVSNPQAVTLSTATEIDTANALTVDASTTIALSPATETDVANTLTVEMGGVVTLTAALETDVANPLTVVSPNTILISAALETDTANTLTTISATAKMIGIKDHKLTTPKSTATLIVPKSVGSIRP